MDISIKQGKPDSVKKFLTFRLGKDTFAIDILKIKEIKGPVSMIEVMKVVDAPPHIKGMVSLYQQIIPVIDLHIVYHLEHPLQESLQVIIILNMEKKFLGLLMDGILDMIELFDEQIKPAPDFLTTIDHDYIQGISTHHDQILHILDIEKLMATEELNIKNHINVG